MEVIEKINQYDKFVSLLNNFSRATEATATALDSEGSAIKENEIYLQSIEGRMSTLKATMEGFWLNLIDSNLIRSGVGLLQTLADGLTGLQETFGTSGLAVGLLSTAFISFTDNPLKKFISGIASSETPVVDLMFALKNLKTETTKTTVGMTTAQKTTTLLKTAYTQLGLQAVFATVKTIALQAVLTGGLSLAISGVVSLLSNMFSGLLNVEGKMQDLETASKSLADSMEKSKTNSVDIEAYKEVQEKLKDSNLSVDERNKLEEELVDVKKRLYELDGNAYSILENTTLGYQEQYEWLKKINEEKVKENAEALNKEMSGGFFTDQESQMNTRAKELEGYITNLQELKRLQKENSGGTFSYGVFGEMDLTKQNEEIAKLEQNIKSAYTELTTYNSNVKLIEDANVKTTLSTIDLDDSTKDFLETLNKSTDALEENTKAKEENSNISSGEEDVKKLTESYAETLKELQDIYDLSESLADVTEMTPDLVNQIAKKYPELGADITDVAKVQEYLNQKIKDQETIANEAFEKLIINDNNYYQNKLLNDQNWVNSFRESLVNMGMAQEDAYNLDLSQFQNLNQLKVYAMNTLGKGIEKWLNQFIDTSADGYNIDFNNFKSFADAKVRVLEALNAEIKKVTENLNTMQKRADFASNMANLFPSGSTQGKFANSQLTQAQKKIEEYTNKLNSLNGAIKEVENKIPNIGVGGISLGNIGSNPISASPSSSSDKGSSSSSKSESTYKATLEQWYALTDAIEDNNNAIERNKILRERASGTKEEQKYIEKEIELLKKQINLKKQLQAEMEKERESLKKYIASRGGQFNGENLTNYEALLNWTAVGDDQIASYKALIASAFKTLSN